MSNASGRRLVAATVRLAIPVGGGISGPPVVDAMASRSYDKVADICNQIMLQIASQGLAFQDEWSFAVHLLGHIYLNDLQLVAAGGNDMKQCLDKETPMVLCLHGQLTTKTAAIGVGSCATNNQLNNLALSFNSFNGTIPTFIGSLSQLTYLDLSENSLYGTIPPELGNLTNLQELDLDSVGRCRVEKVEWLSHLSQLEVLVIDGVSLSKANHWVDVISNLPKLSWLSLQGCELSQVMYPYSSSFLNSSYSSIVKLYLNNNNLTSSMYRWLFPLTTNNLLSLDLSGNMLEDTKEQSDSDAPENNPQYTTVYVGNLGPEVRPLNPKIYLYETSHEKLRAESCNKLKVKSYYYETLLLKPTVLTCS
ncbi:unnamed protein product [Lactuca saligna]|uniref:Disease resistance R13L4/SHOC-2-like LRR domain-containing protein n=1 Tax=Lactuca saligna TaxID=75948 RepID=A0AA35YE80_LACSI|nr:unnamed protein product [Lactuca saligna]